MAMMVFKVTFTAQKGRTVYTNIVRTITYYPDLIGQTYGSFDLQTAIDRLTAQMKNEGYERIELLDVQNISTPIIRRKN